MGDELLGGRYRLEDVLGWGGMATVWRAWDTRLDRPVAVKVRDRGDLREPSATERFDREARTVARLTDPHIVSVYDVGTQDGVGYIVMELVDGVTVASMLADGPLPIDRAVSIAGQAADALGAAHAVGVVHRDVKPANIMVTPAGAVKVCDFGIARELHADAATLTAPHTAIGSAAYMAPEQAAGDPVDARTDLYGLGCVLYAMLTGAPPFTGDQPMEILYQQLHQTPVPVRSRRPEVPPALDALVMSLLAKNPADRPAGAAAVRVALDSPRTRVTAPAVASGGPAAAVGPSPATASPVNGKPWPAGAIVAGRPPGPNPTRPLARAAAPVPAPPAPAGEQFRYPAGRHRHFLTPVIAALAVVGLLIAGAFVVTALLDRQRANPRTAPTHAPAPGTTASSPAASPTASTPAAAGDPVDPVRTVVQQMVSTGQLDAGAADDLNRQLDGIGRDLAKGHTDKAGHEVGQMRDHLDGLVKDGKLSPAGYVALTAALDTLAAAIPSTNDNDGG